MQKKIEGKTLDGEKRFYTFELMDTMTGLELEHGKLSHLLHNDDLLDVINGDDFEGGRKFANDVTLGVYTFEDLKELASKMLPSATIMFDGKQHVECDENGICDLFQGDLEEFATALFWAMYANFPKSTDPLFEAVKAAGLDPKTTGQNQTTSESQESEAV